jgi:primosomal protein N' (replication factor Y)
MTLVAKVRFSSPLPQLDKEFDYLVPAHLQEIVSFGHLVEVQFGKGGKSKTGLICDLVEDDSPRENLLPIQSLVTAVSQISHNQLELCKAVALRQAGTVGELISIAVPKRFIRAEDKYDPASAASPQLKTTAHGALPGFLKSAAKVYFVPELLSESTTPNWALEFADACKAELDLGKSCLVVLPDFAELEKFERALGSMHLMDKSFRHSSSDSGSQRYLNHLRSLSEIGINYGLRGAAFAPAVDLGLILLWDDGDDSHTEQSAPYWTSREVLLQRSELEDTRLVLASHSPSSEVIRLVEIDYLKPLISQRVLPKVLITELVDRLDADTHVRISNSLKAGKPALMQISNAGWASALVCVGCKEIRICPSCSSSVWVDPTGKFRCRSCKTAMDLGACVCGKTNVKPTRLGASAISKQMEKAFPAFTVVHSNGESRLTHIESGPLLVIATPGAEPEVEGGYDCVVIADATYMAGSPRLRAVEQSLGKWANAISLASNSAEITLVGLKGSLAEQMRELNFHAAVKEDYSERFEIGLPPARRLASITSSNQSDHLRLVELLSKSLDSTRSRVLQIDTPSVYAIDYQYSYGLELAQLLKETTGELTRTSKSKRPGERVYRVNMDDSKVI